MQRQLMRPGTADIPVHWQGLTATGDVVGGDSGPCYAYRVLSSEIEALWSRALGEPPGVARMVISFIVRGQCGFVSDARRSPKQLGDVSLGRGGGVI
jgi:hypothetical protein